MTDLDSLGDALEGILPMSSASNSNGYSYSAATKEARGRGEGEAATPNNAQGKIQHQSLKTKPGAMKKRERIAAMERDRFALNLARMAGKGCAAPGGDTEGGEDDAGGGGCGGGMMLGEGVEGGGGGKGGGKGGGGEGGGEAKQAQGEGSASKERWAAIRNFITQTMERKMEGVGGEGRVGEVK